MNKIEKVKEAVIALFALCGEFLHGGNEGNEGEDRRPQA